MLFVSGFITKLILLFFDQGETQQFDPYDNSIITSLGLFDNIQLFSIDWFHFMYGSFLVGIFGCFGFIFNILPMHTRVGLRRNDIGSVVMLIVVVVGVSRVFFMTFNWVKVRAHTILILIEDKVLNEDGS